MFDFSKPFLEWFQELKKDALLKKWLSYTSLPFLIRLGILIGGCSLIILFSYQVHNKNVATKKAEIEKKISNIKKQISLLREAKKDKDIMIFEEQILEPEEMKTFLQNSMKRFSGISLINVSFPKKQPLMDYLLEKEEKKKAKRRRGKRKESRAPRRSKKPARMATIEKLTKMLNLKTEDLVAQKVHMEFYGTYEGTLKYLKKIASQRDILWNKIEYNVEHYPTAHVSLKLYYITKKGS